MLQQWWYSHWCSFHFRSKILDCVIPDFIGQLALFESVASFVS